jgi:prepilin-type N-terminal cleavage/methylation domain-containing protein/prepilin-type processing-associated H-X9-DG protein
MQRRAGFTLIELLVVVGIIALLLAILLPALGRAKQDTRRIVCLSNLRQMAMAAQSYSCDNDASYPIAYYSESTPQQTIRYMWDYVVTKDKVTRKTTVAPGILWQGKTIQKIQQCPSFSGKSNDLVEDVYTGYNYNTSYIGHGSLEAIVRPARVTDVRRPAECALFGDGEFSGGANKYMRSPLPSPSDETLTGRSAGTQGFRHNGRTNVTFCDGHGDTLAKAYAEADAGDTDKVAPGTGFLSPDNSLYDLE